jgi:hypothetical protein
VCGYQRNGTVALWTYHSDRDSASAGTAPERCHWPNPDAHRHTNQYTDEYANAHSHTDSHADGNEHAHGDANPHRDADAITHPAANRNGNRFGNADRHVASNGHAGTGNG